jgi:hypothetical protein
MKVLGSEHLRSHLNVTRELSVEEWLALSRAANDLRYDMGRSLAILTPGLPPEFVPTKPMTTTVHLYVAPDISDDEAIHRLCNEVEKRMWPATLTFQ